MICKSNRNSRWVRRCSIDPITVLSWLGFALAVNGFVCRRVGTGQCSSTTSSTYPNADYPPMLSMGSLITNTWRTGYNPIALRPVGRANHASATFLLRVDNETVEETMLMFGGVSDRADFASETWLYQPRRNAWVMLQVEPLAPRFGHSMITGPSGDYVILLGGCSWNTQPITVSQYLFYNMTWHAINVNTTHFPNRFLHSTVILPHYHSQLVDSTSDPTRYGSVGPATSERRIFVFGGSLCQNHEGVEIGELWQLHFDANDFSELTSDNSMLEWEMLNITGDSPSRRVGHVGVSTPYDSMLIFGGFFNSTLLTDLWEFSFDAHAKSDWVWTELPTLPMSAASMRTCTSVTGSYVDHDDSLIVAFSCGDNQTLSAWSYLYVNKTWEYLTPVGIQAPLPLSFSSMAVVDQQLLVFGGRTPYGLSSVDVWAFVKRTEFSMWAVQPEPASYPPPRALHASAFCPFHGTMFVIGGLRIDLEPPDVKQPPVLTDNVVWQWNASFDRWTQQPVPKKFPPRMASAAQIIDGFLIVFGGIDGSSKSLSDTWVVDTTTYLWYRTSSDFIPPARGAHTMVAFGRNAIIYGGLNADSGTLLNDICFYDLVDDIWKCMPPSGPQSPVGRFGHGAAVVDHFMYVFGGVAANDYGFDNKLWRYDLVNHVWQIVAGDSESSYLAQPRFFASLTAIGKKLILLGGCTAYSSVSLYPNTWYTQLPVFCWDNGNRQELNLANVFDTTLISSGQKWNYRGQWTFPLVLKTPPPMFMQHSSVELNGSLIVYGGISYKFLYNESIGAGQKWVVSLGCDTGYFSQSFAVKACQRCPLATFSTSPGQTKCQVCPNGTFTGNTGSTMLSNCSLCDAEKDCHGHGDCVVEHTSGQFTATCQCHFGYSSSDRCNLPIYYMIGASGAVTVIIIVVLTYVLHKYSQKRKEEKEKARLLRTSRQEIAELSNAWLINPEELTIKQRIDKEFPGSFGQVHLAEYRGFTVAIKKLAVALGTGESRLFERELETMRAIRHPNIVLFLGGGQMIEKENNRPVPFIVMEHMARGTLRQILADSTVNVDHAQQLRFALDIAKGLRFLHSLIPPRIHRDLKSTNLLVSDRWVVKVADFGSAARFDVTNRSIQSAMSRRLSSAASDDDLLPPSSPVLEARADGTGHSAADETTPLLHTQAPLSSRVGTVAWSAPELLSNLSYGAGVDVYSFGIVLWEVCTRCVPFQEYPFTCDVRNAVLSGVRPTIPVTCSAAYRTLMQECWHGDHMQRPTFAEIVPKLDEQLEMCLSSGVERNPSASPSRPASTLTIQ